MATKKTGAKTTTAQKPKKRGAKAQKKPVKRGLSADLIPIEDETWLVQPIARR